MGIYIYIYIPGKTIFILRWASAACYADNRTAEIVGCCMQQFQKILQKNNIQILAEAYISFENG